MKALYYAATLLACTLVLIVAVPQQSEAVNCTTYTVMNANTACTYVITILTTCGTTFTVVLGPGSTASIPAVPGCCIQAATAATTNPNCPPPTVTVSGCTVVLI